MVLRIFWILLLVLPLAVRADVPPSPSPMYIVDQSKVLSNSALNSINQQLKQFEQDSSNQVVVAIYPKQGEPGDIAGYAKHVFNTWGIGQARMNNGVLLLICTEDHKLNITVGDGLHGAVSDKTCKTIIDDEIVPQIKAGNFEGGINSGVSAIIAATRGQYKGKSFLGSINPATLYAWLIVGGVLFIFVMQGIYGERYRTGAGAPSWVVPILILAMIIGFVFALIPGRRRGWWGGGGGGGGGFSGGGGSSSGGGASGSW